MTSGKPSKLDDLLRAVHDEGMRGQSFDHNKGINTAKTDFLALIEEVVGSDEPEIDNNRHLVGKIIRNKLRAEMRLRKDAL